MKKNFLILSIIFSVVLFFILFIIWFAANGGKIGNNNVSVVNSDIEVLTPKPNELILSPLKITGIINGDSWIGFEGQVGIVKLFDSNDQELAIGILTATTDWMTLPVNFETNLFFDYPGEGSGRLVFYNENPSGDPVRDKTFVVPVKFK